MPRFEPTQKKNGLTNTLSHKTKSKQFRQIATKTSTSLPKPLRVNCFQCRKSFEVKFVVPHKDYSQKNSWDYWTGKGKNKKICNICLKNLYYDKLTYWQTITDLKKRNILRNYIYDGSI